MSIRSKLLVGCAAILAITILLGLFMLANVHATGQLAEDVYDNALIGVKYAQKVQTDFVRWRPTGLVAGTASERTVGREQFAILLEDLNIAIDRAITKRGRTAALRVRVELEHLRAANSAGPSAQALDRVDRDLTGLVNRYVADGFVYRIRAERLIGETDEWMLVSLAIAAVLALAVTLMSPCRSPTDISTTSLFRKAAAKRRACWRRFRPCRRLSPRAAAAPNP
jgi:hypothetical protein